MKPARKVIAPFTWWRCPDGYRIEKREDGEFLAATTSAIERISPDSNIVQELAQLGESYAENSQKDAALETVRSFAGRHGLPHVGEFSGLPHATTEGEGAWAWLHLATKIAVAAHMWALIIDAARKGDEKGLREHVQWRGRDFVYVGRPPARATTILVTEKSGWAFGPPDLLAPATSWLRTMVDAYLHGAVSARLDYDGRGGYVLLFAATDLANYCWLRLAEDISGSRSYRPCVNCGTWMPISPDEGKRRSRQTCSDRCRTQVYLKRKEARHLHAKGMRPAEIMKKLGVKDVDTVKDWLKRSK
jgi:hypothetical protein